MFTSNWVLSLVGYSILIILVGAVGTAYDVVKNTKAYSYRIVLETLYKHIFASSIVIAAILTLIQHIGKITK